MKAFEFYTKLTETLKEKLGNEWIAELHTDVILNNGTNHIALILYKNGEKLHPQIYLERFFEDYKKGKTEYSGRFSISCPAKWKSLFRFVFVHTES